MNIYNFIFKRALVTCSGLILSLMVTCSPVRDEQVTDKVNQADSTLHSDPAFIPQVMRSGNTYAISSYKDLLELFEENNYTPESWQAGIREVPRLFLTTIGERWGSTTTKEISVLQKKQIFFRGLAPLVLRANELILKDRDRLDRLRSDFNSFEDLENIDKHWLLKLCTLYRIDTPENKVTVSMLDELWKRVDIIPPSLALSQSAEESGWGTSRFAAQGNALYGQWTWGTSAMAPEQQRKELGNYGIAAFDSPIESVAAYMLNLNTHRAYSGLRDKRAELRKKDRKITGAILAEQLTSYSERGEEYVNTLKSLMDYNRLNPVDDAYLSNGKPVYIISGEPAKE